MNYLKLITRRGSFYIEIEKLKAAHTNFYLKDDFSDMYIVSCMEKATDWLFQDSKQYILDWVIDYLDEVLIRCIKDIIPGKGQSIKNINKLKAGQIDLVDLVSCIEMQKED